MTIDTVFREEVRSYLDRSFGTQRSVPATPEELLDVVMNALSAATPDVAFQMVMALSGFLEVVAEPKKKQEEEDNADGNRS